jgi:hypothetical protein
MFPNTKKRAYFFAYVTKTIVGMIVVILGYVIFRYFGAVSAVAAIVLMVVIIFYGLCFDHKIMSWLEQKYTND